MSRFHIGDLCTREELLDGRDCIVGNIAGLGASHEKRRPTVLGRIGLAERKVGHVVKGLAKNRQRDAELQLRLGADEVGQKKLTNREGLASS